MTGSTNGVFPGSKDLPQRQKLGLQKKKKGGGDDAFGNGSCHAGSCGVVARSPRGPAAFVAAVWAAANVLCKTRNPSAIRKRRGPGLNAKRCTLTLQAAERDRGASSFFLFFFFPYLQSGFI